MQLLDLMMECEPCKLHDLVHLLGNISLTLNLHPKLAVLSRHCERQGHVSLTEIPKLYKKTSLEATGEHQWESYFCAFNCRGYFCFAEGWRERVGCNCLCWSSLALLKLYSFSCLSHPKEGGQSDFETKLLVSANAFCTCQSRKTNPVAFFNNLAYILFSQRKPQGIVRDFKLILKARHVRFNLHKFKGNVHWHKHSESLMLLSFKFSCSFEKKEFSVSLLSRQCENVSKICQQ